MLPNHVYALGCEAKIAAVAARAVSFVQAVEAGKALVSLVNAGFWAQRTNAAGAEAFFRIVNILRFCDSVTASG